MPDFYSEEQGVGLNYKAPFMLTSVRRVNLGKNSPVENHVPSNFGAEQDGVQVSCLVKRTIDVLGDAFLIVLFSPLFVLVSIFALLDDGRPLIYRRRVLANGVRVFDSVP
jgi:lipopolysaccharide/colanic/teichoic acid biosynthesis glycosyltransferase